MRVRRGKPYVCIDIDFAEHFRFQRTVDLEAAAGTWLRCLAYSRAQEQDGIVKAGWLRRTFAANYERVDELVKVGLLCARADGDYEIHAYAPRNQTRAMIEEERVAARERMSTLRSAAVGRRAPVRPNNDRTNTEQAANERRTNPNTIPVRDVRSEARPIHENDGSHGDEPSAALASTPSSDPTAVKNSRNDEGFGVISNDEGSVPGDLVRPNNDRTNGEQAANEHRTNAFVPTSIKASLSSSSLDHDPFLRRDLPPDVRAVPRADAPGRAGAERLPLPPSERSLSGPFWLAAFSDGIREQTGRPCSFGRVFLGTIERILTHHAPERDAAAACAWLKAEAKAFASQWDGKHPAKGLTPDGLERWLNEGRKAPPVFGRTRVVQPPADKWQGDDWSDLGAQVDE